MKTLEEIANRTACIIAGNSFDSSSEPTILAALREVERQAVERCKGWMSHKKACNIEISKRHGWMKLDCSCGLEAALKNEPNREDLNHG